jgi:DNA-binding MarR family transcriptional regulator/GNAT superfamily N-acetyltransferase
MGSSMPLAEQVRHFNRFYTREIGLLAEHLPGSPLSLTEARVLYELAHATEPAAADIIRTLRMDKAHASRIIARFRRAGWVKSRASPQHGRRKLLALTASGMKLFRRLNEGTQAQIESLIAPLAGAARRRLSSGLRQVQDALQPNPASGSEVRLRALRAGDLGLIAHRQAVLYQREYGWDWTFEGLLCRIVGEFAANFDPAREDAWVAELRGEIIGSVFLVKETGRTAKLRLLYVEPAARGLGVGTRLVHQCIARARQLGYESMVLWTHDVLAAARHIYEAAGFTLQQQEQRHSFGKSVTSQIWKLDLAATTRGSGRCNILRILPKS